MARPALLVLALAGIGGATAIGFTWYANAAGPPPLPREPDPAAIAADPWCATATAPGTAAESVVAAVDRSAAPAGPEADDAAATALLAASGGEGLVWVVAEVRALGAIQTTKRDDRELLRQSMRLRVLEVRGQRSHRGLRRYAIVDAPLCPAISQERFGCSTPFGVVQVGDVRSFVLGRGRPDLGAIGALFGADLVWVVLAGARVPPPADPVLAAVPNELHVFLSRPLTNVFRGRVHELRLRGASVRTTMPASDRILVDVTSVAHHGGRFPLEGRVTVIQAPFTSGVDLSGLVVGSECWFATDDAPLWQVLRAFAR